MPSTFIAGAVVTAAASAASAQEVPLRAVSAFAEKTTYSRGFELFIEGVNEAGKGVLQINYMGGPEATPPLQACYPPKTRSARFSKWPGAFYTKGLREGGSLDLTTRGTTDITDNS